MERGLRTGRCVFGRGGEQRGQGGGGIRGPGKTEIVLMTEPKEGSGRLMEKSGADRLTTSSPPRWLVGNAGSTHDFISVRRVSILFTVSSASLWTELHEAKLLQ